VYDDGVMTAHHVRRGCKEFRSVLTSLVMVAPTDQGHVNTTQVEELVLEKQDTVRDLSTAMELSMKTVHSTICEELRYSGVCAW
jgi:hypothetical protein